MPKTPDFPGMLENPEVDRLSGHQVVHLPLGP
jgi:hypothetical protein